jgi:hypothetical protein
MHHVFRVTIGPQTTAATGSKRIDQTRERAARLGVERPALQQEEPEKLQFSGLVYSLMSCRAMTMRWIWLVPW